RRGIHKVSDFRNKQAIVLAWFPLAQTRGCTLECKSLADHGDPIKSTTWRTSMGVEYSRVEQLVFFVFGPAPLVSATSSSYGNGASCRPRRCRSRRGFGAHVAGATVMGLAVACSRRSRRRTWDRRLTRRRSRASPR